MSDDEIPNYKTYTTIIVRTMKRTILCSGVSFGPFGESLSCIDWTKKIIKSLISSWQHGRRGYIRRDLQSIVDDMAFTQNIYTTKEEVERLLVNYMQKLINWCWCSKLQECLKIQLENKQIESKSIELALDIVTIHSDPLLKSITRLMMKHDISEDELRNAISEIETQSKT